MSKRWVIVSNRLPFHYDSGKKKFVISTGGLVSSLLGVSYRQPVLWLGLTTENYDREQIASAMRMNTHINVIPIVVPHELYDTYYNGFCNGVLWPLLHYETDSVDWHLNAWRKYQEVNKLVAQEILKHTSPTADLLWIHDFHLMLVASYLRRNRRNQALGFFLHVPFPSYEIFRQLPFRSTILRCLLSHDVIGFHDYTYLMHFAQTIHYVLGVPSSSNRVLTMGRNVELGVYPVSIPTTTITRAAKQKKVKDLYAGYRERFGSKKIILGVDRLDYIKGIDLKLDIFHTFLTKYREYRGQVSLMQIVVPSRTEVLTYQQLKENIEGKVGLINGHWGKADYVPVYYIYNSLQFHELLALYQLSDCLLITSKRDGMNLVALEYVAAQTSTNPGQVLLSEFAGAISIMPNAIAINPWNIDKSAESICRALQEQPEETIVKNTQMMEYLKNYTGDEWASSFMADLSKSAQKSGNPVVELNVSARKIPPVITKIKNAKEQVLFLDFDGTLTPIQANPRDAKIDPESLSILAEIRKIGYNIVIISGRERSFLSEQFAGQNFMLVAEHGAEFFASEGKRWQSLVASPKDNWFPLALEMMTHYHRRVPSSMVEKKDNSVVWHYRNSPALYADYQARKLTEELEFGLANFPAVVTSGKKVVEAKAIEASKGTFGGWFIKHHLTSTDAVIVAIGDDLTDEELFRALRPEDISIKVGMEETDARYRLREQKDVARFLKFLC